MKSWQDFEQRFPMMMHALKHASQQGKLGYSFLLDTSGSEEKQCFPRVLAALAACVSPRSDGSPCGVCEVCKSLLNGTYPDFFTLAPVSKSHKILIGDDADDPDTLRQFESYFHLTGISPSGWRFGVIQDADSMTDSQQNAFLKILEEPPKKSIFILTTSKLASLLPTTRSRCQIISLTDNFCKYESVCFEKLPNILMKLQFHAKNDIVQTEECTLELIDIMDSLSKAAADTVNAKWADELQKFDTLESAGQKLIEKRIDGEISGEYRRLREQFSSLIHAWFAQIYMLSSKIDRKYLPNPEIVNVFLNDPEPHVLHEREALRQLTEAENLTQLLNTNVNDELAIRTFSLSIAMQRK